MRGTSVPRLRAITVYHSSAAIHALACEYSLAGDDEDANGEQRVRMAVPWGIPHSFGSRRVRATIKLSAGEYLTAVEGTTGHFGDGPDVVVVTSLTFRSSRGKTYGPYGGSGTGTATPFSIPAASGCIVGFWGRSGRLLDAIGVYIKPSHCSSASVERGRLNRLEVLVTEAAHWRERRGFLAKENNSAKVNLRG
ncbi:salt stress-induced protein-like [Miscanthus floridulus]|uniref:salt stress-induced protein-like n=1 Tax=Miscanthus floridulus TaxID=154761 RepID=UPI003459F003